MHLNKISHAHCAWLLMGTGYCYFARMLLLGFQVAGWGRVRSAERGRHLIRTEDLHFDAAVLGPRLAGSRFVDRPLLSKTDHVDAVDRNVVLSHEIFHHAIRTTAAQDFVVCLGPRRIGVAFHGDEEALSAFHLHGELVEFSLGIVAQCVLVEREWYRRRP